MIATARSTFASGTSAATSRLAAAGGLGELARVVPAEAAGDDLAHELVLAALQDRDVPLREAGPRRAPRPPCRRSRCRTR